MILLASKILEAVEAGDIAISPFNIKNLSPNSYDCTLQPTLLRYTSDVLDMATDNPTEVITIPEEGYVLMPGAFYLGATNETAASKRYVPCLEGRSSIARLGISVHTSAGFGDIFWSYDAEGNCTHARWTLELTVAKPVRVYPNRRVCQVFFFDVLGNPEGYKYAGKYSHQQLPQSSMIHKDHEATQIRKVGNDSEKETL